MLHEIAFVVLLAAEPEWNSIIVRFDIDRDGKLRVTEQVQVDVPSSVQRLERPYADVDAITLYTDHTIPLEESSDLDRAHHFHQDSNKVLWSVRDKDARVEEWRSLTYVIESRVDDAVIPAWSIPRGDWRELLDNPRHRFLVDYFYEMPPPSTKGTQIQLQIYWPPGWKPVHEITPDTVAQEVDRGWRVHHLFEEDGRRELINDDFTNHTIRMAAIAGLPLVLSVLFVLFALRELLRRRPPPDGEQLAREVIYSEEPEVIQARWSGHAPHVPIEDFLGRMEKKSTHSPFEQTLEFLLKEKGGEYDHTEILHELLKIESHAARRRTPWSVRLASFAIFITGVYFAVREPKVLAIGFAACALLFFPPWRSFFLLIPLALMSALMIVLHPAGIYACGGLAAMLLGTAVAILASGATRNTPLARARRWLKEELKSPAPRIRHDARRWLAALGLESS